jgi:6-phosphogluconolactonase
MPSTRSIEVLANATGLFHAAAEEFLRAARTAIGAQGRFAVALSGGSTPKSLYSLLAANYADFAWNRVFLFFGDERHVPPTDPESNYGMVQESLLSKIAIPAENVFRVPAENPDAAAAASEYETQIGRFFEVKPGQLKPGEFPRVAVPRFPCARRTDAFGGRQLGREVQHSPHHLHLPRAQSRSRSPVHGQRGR